MYPSIRVSLQLCNCVTMYVCMYVSNVCNECNDCNDCNDCNVCSVCNVCNVVKCNVDVM